MRHLQSIYKEQGGDNMGTTYRSIKAKLRFQVESIKDAWNWKRGDRGFVLNVVDGQWSLI